MVLANKFPAEVLSRDSASMYETNQEWNPKQQEIHNIYFIVDKCNYNWCPDSVYSSKCNDLVDLISLFPHFFFIALFVEMQRFFNPNVIKSVILHRVMPFELLIMCHFHLHNFLSHLRLPIHLCWWRVMPFFNCTHIMVTNESFHESHTGFVNIPLNLTFWVFFHICLFTESFLLNASYIIANLEASLRWRFYF